MFMNVGETMCKCVFYILQAANFPESIRNGAGNIDGDVGDPLKI